MLQETVEYDLLQPYFDLSSAAYLCLTYAVLCDLCCRQQWRITAVWDDDDLFNCVSDVKMYLFRTLLSFGKHDQQSAYI